jgi:hypothetical protein
MGRAAARLVDEPEPEPDRVASPEDEVRPLSAEECVLAHEKLEAASLSKRRSVLGVLAPWMPPGTKFNVLFTGGSRPELPYCVKREWAAFHVLVHGRSPNAFRAMLPDIVSNPLERARSAARTSSAPEAVSDESDGEEPESQP